MSDQGRVTRKLVRRTDDKVVAGVCSGLADHLGVDPLVVRIGFVALALTGGGVLAYLAAWALIPPAGSPTGKGALRAPSLGLVLLVGAGVITAAAIAGFLVNVLFPLGPLEGVSPEPLGLAALLVVAGVLLLRTPEESPGKNVEEIETAGAAAGATTTRRLVMRRPRERSGLTPLTLAVALLIGGGTALAANAGWVPLDVGQIAALALVVVGLGLVAGAWVGRARLLIPVGVLMIPAVLVASLIDFPPSGSIGGNYVMPTDAGELEDIRVLAGQVTLDLSEYPFADGTEEARLRVAAGSINVHVPHGVHVEVDATVQGGEAYVLGGHESGFDISVADSAGPADATKRLELEIEAGFGTVGVYRYGRPDTGRREERRDGRRDADGERKGARTGGGKR
ncbi:MAG: PspC domain-containing protein [Actinomycetota bacterium]|nr:PspC domain-containing protein [Actinomycetota bacterium]